jgi:hypothetical protein
MKLKEIKDWIESLPNEFLEFDVVNAEEGKLDKENDIWYRFDKPIRTLVINEETKEILFLNDNPDEDI